MIGARCAEADDELLKDIHQDILCIPVIARLDYLFIFRTKTDFSSKGMGVMFLKYAANKYSIKTEDRYNKW